MERHPAIYGGKDEETLRDHFLMVLSPHFQSTTGETFNKAGKTDILIRHERQNVFVAECKFWGGMKGFHATIDQLLGYLTWRDSKAAVISFVRNKELNPVLETIGKETAKHPSPDGRRMLTGSHDKTARFWDTSTGECRTRFAILDPYPACAAAGFGGRRKALPGRAWMCVAKRLSSLSTAART